MRQVQDTCINVHMWVKFDMYTSTYKTYESGFSNLITVQ